MTLYYKEGRKEGRKEMFYLMTHSTRKEGSILFNNKNTFYLRLYGFGYMVKDHSDSERRNPYDIVL